ncbi:hypothetical protein [Escherichia coli]
MFDGELSFALKLAREMGRPDWRVNDAPEQADDAGPAEPVSAGKCSTVS